MKRLKKCKASPSSLQIKFLAFFLLFALAAKGTAETVYKYIDEDGNTVYSSNPPPAEIEQVDKLKVPVQKPSPEQLEEAHRIHQRNLKAGETMEKTRKKREEAIAEENRRKRENALKYQKYEEPGEMMHSPYDPGPYYGIPGHGVIVLPGGPSIRPPGARPPGARPPGARPPVIRPPGVRPST